MTTKRLQHPDLNLENIVGKVKIVNGGTDADNASQAVTNLGGLSRNMLGLANGPVPIQADGKINISFFDAVSGDIVTVTGPATLLVNAVGTYIVTNNDSFKPYTVTPVAGSVSKNINTITYTAPSNDGSSGFTINDRLISIPVTLPPASYSVDILNPVNAIVNEGASVTLKINTVGIPNGTQLKWRVNPSSTVTGFDFGDGTSSTLPNGIITINSNQSEDIVITPRNDITTEGNETFSVQLLSMADAILGLSNSITVNDSSLTPPSINQASLLTPTNGATSVALNTSASCSAISYTNGSDTHTETIWQIATDNAFTNLVYEQQNIIGVTPGITVGNVNNWSIPLLVKNTLYYIRVRQKGQVIGYGPWSNIRSFTTIDMYVNTPTWIDISGAPLTNIGPNATLLSSAFSSFNGGVHEATDWQICLVGDNYVNVLFQSLNDTVNKTSWLVTGLQANTQYVRRVRYKDSVLGWSDWSVNLNSGLNTRVNFYPVEIQLVRPVNSYGNNSYKYFESMDYSEDGKAIVMSVSYGADNVRYITRTLLSDSFIDGLYDLYDRQYDSSPFANYSDFTCLAGNKGSIINGDKTANWLLRAGSTNLSFNYTYEQIIWLNGTSTHYPSTNAITSINSLSYNYGGDRLAASYTTQDIQCRTEIIHNLPTSTQNSYSRITIEEVNLQGEDLGTISKFDRLANRIIIANPYKNVSSVSKAGEVTIRVYNAGNNTWDIESTLSQAIPIANAKFGISVTLSPNGDKAAIMYFKENNIGIGVDIYSRVNTSWTKTGTISIDSVGGYVIDGNNIIDVTRTKPNNKNMKFSSDNSKLLIGIHFMHYYPLNIKYGEVSLYDTSSPAPVKSTSYLSSLIALTAINANREFNLGESVHMDLTGSSFMLYDSTGVYITNQTTDGSSVAVSYNL